MDKKVRNNVIILILLITNITTLCFYYTLRRANRANCEELFRLEKILEEKRQFNGKTDDTIIIGFDSNKIELLLNWKNLVTSFDSIAKLKK